jgi:polyisoprenoid-binding protein YceI
VKHLGIATVRGRFEEFEGTLEVGDDLSSARAFGTAQVNSISTDDAGRDEHLRSADFFGAEANPELRFESTAVRPLDEDTFEIEGTLTMNGVTNPVTLTAVVEGTETDPWGNDRVGLEVTGRINRSDWNMSFNQALGSGNLLVGEKVTLTLEISAVKQA